jgi:hypothetical protein
MSSLTVVYFFGKDGCQKQLRVNFSRMGRRWPAHNLLTTKRAWLSTGGLLPQEPLALGLIAIAAIRPMG